MNCAKDRITKLKRGRTEATCVVMLIFCCAVLTGCDESAGVALPPEGADVVVERFYEYISEAKIKGGTTPLREAYKLISSDKSRLSKAKFMEIVGKYPAGFKADIIGSEINGTMAKVSIAYKMPSAFDAYTVNTDVLLNLDKATNSWKIDFTGETSGEEKTVDNTVDNKGSQ